MDIKLMGNDNFSTYLHKYITIKKNNMLFDTICSGTKVLLPLL